MTTVLITAGWWKITVFIFCWAAAFSGAQAFSTTTTTTMTPPMPVSALSLSSSRLMTMMTTTHHHHHHYQSNILPNTKRQNHHHYHRHHHHRSTVALRSASMDDPDNDNDDNGGGGDGGLFSNFNPLYGGLWATFLTFGVFLSPGQVGDPLDLQMIQSYIDNPTAPTGINPLFLIVFNGLGLMPIILAQLACPQGRRGGDDGGLPAAPFLVASMAMGFGGAGCYLTFRAPPVDSKTQAEASWFTRNILENKLMSVGVIALLASTFVSAAGLAGGGEDGTAATWATVVSDYGALAQQSKFVSVSSLDLAILTISAATLIPRDYQLRVPEGQQQQQAQPQEDDVTSLSSSLGQKIAVGTLFLPIVGAALYCLWRPSLPEE